MKPINMTWLCIAAIAITACKKEKPEQIGQGIFNSHPNMRKIEQKSMDVSPAQALAIIKKFKSGIGASNETLNSRLIKADSVSVDSSIFVIEAALNYDFDAAVDSSYDVLSDTTEITLNYSRETNKLSSDGLEEAYAQLTSAITAICQANGGSKVKAVDIEAYEVGRDLLLKAKVLQVLSVLPNPCQYVSTANVSPYWQIYDNWYVGANPSPIPPKPDAVTVLNGLLNCERLMFCSTGESIYYINVTTIPKSSINTPTPVHGTNPINPNPSALFSSPWMTQQAMYTTYVSLNPTQISTYRNGCSTLIYNNTPPGKVNINNQITRYYDYDPGMPNALPPIPPTWCVYWKLEMTYATNAGCRPTPSH